MHQKEKLEKLILWYFNSDKIYSSSLKENSSSLKKILVPWLGSSVRALPQYVRVASSIPCQGTRKKQPMNA